AAARPPRKCATPRRSRHRRPKGASTTRPRRWPGSPRADDSAPDSRSRRPPRRPPPANRTCRPTLSLQLGTSTSPSPATTNVKETFSIHEQYMKHIAKRKPAVKQEVGRRTLFLVLRSHRDAGEWDNRRRGTMASKHVALIRGINVGRAKRVGMADLRALVEDL